MVLSTPVRVVNGQELPAPGRYEIDPGHSLVGFEARHLMVTKVRGNFQQFTGAIEIGDRYEDSSVAVEIDAASIDSGNVERDNHLRTSDFLGVSDYPQLSFRSRVVRTERGQPVIDGDLTIRGVSRPVTLQCEFEGGVVDPWGEERIAFTGSTQINRDDWSMTWNVPMDGSRLLVSKDIKVVIEVQAIRAG
jgi:polyisoprenoid-binding protein YceI